MLAQLFEDRPFLYLLLWLRWKVSCCCNRHVIRDHSSLQMQVGWSLCCTALRMLALCGESWASGIFGFLLLIKLVSSLCGLFTPHGLLVPHPAPLCPFSSSCLCTCHYLTILRSDTLSGATFMFTRILFRYYILRVFKWQAVFYFISLLKDYFLYFSFVCARV